MLLNQCRPPWPFFPGFPAVVRAVREIGLPDRGTVVVLNQLIFLIALAGVWRIARRYTNARPARLAVWSLALFPGDQATRVVMASGSGRTSRIPPTR